MKQPTFAVVPLNELNWDISSQACPEIQFLGDSRSCQVTASINQHRRENRTCVYSRKAGNNALYIHPRLYHPDWNFQNVTKWSMSVKMAPVFFITLASELSASERQLGTSALCLLKSRQELCVPSGRWMRHRQTAPTWYSSPNPFPKWSSPPFKSS